MNRNRHRGNAAGWIILVLILAALVGMVTWKMIGKNRDAGSRTRSPATQSD
ncbi:MAG: hypothetical protein PHU85_06970 [Phycisphaerae bacterium]|nr:hypothetical protein [Phycisphaerae bacterium]